MPEYEAVRTALTDLQSRLKRWENALESGELSIEHAAQRIKELHEQRQELLRKKAALDGDRPTRKTVTAIPTARMDAYIAEMRRRLAAQANRGKKGIPPGGSQGGESARRQRHPHLQATSGSI